MSGITDAQLGSGDIGELVHGVRKDTMASVSDADNDLTTFQFDELGRLRTARTIREAVELVASAAQTATEDGTGQTPITVTDTPEEIIFQLDVTAAATEAGDTLDVFVQTTVDGTKWIDIVHFTQVLGNGGAKRYIAKVNRSVAQAMFEVGTALSDSAIRNILGRQFRCRWDVVDVVTADNQSFTFSVSALVG